MLMFNMTYILNSFAIHKNYKNDNSNYPPNCAFSLNSNLKLLEIH
jgi:hypothetical protein